MCCLLLVCVNLGKIAEADRTELDFLCVFIFSSFLILVFPRNEEGEGKLQNIQWGKIMLTPKSVGFICEKQTSATTGS